MEPHISPEKRDEILKLLLDVKENVESTKENIEVVEILSELQKEINTIHIVCTHMKKELYELKEQFKDLRDSFLMKVMMEKVAYVPLEKLPIYKNKSKE
jgi:predicted nuclease with TOPRIM domain